MPIGRDKPVKPQHVFKRAVIQEQKCSCSGGQKRSQGSPREAKTDMFKFDGLQRSLDPSYRSDLVQKTPKAKTGASNVTQRQKEVFDRPLIVPSSRKRNTGAANVLPLQPGISYRGRHTLNSPKGNAGSSKGVQQRTGKSKGTQDNQTFTTTDMTGPRHVGDPTPNIEMSVSLIRALNRKLTEENTAIRKCLDLVLERCDLNTASILVSAMSLVDNSLRNFVTGNANIHQLYYFSFSI